METFLRLFRKMMKNSATVQTLAVRNRFFHCFLNEENVEKIKITLS